MTDILPADEKKAVTVPAKMPEHDVFDAHLESEDPALTPESARDWKADGPESKRGDILAGVYFIDPQGRPMWGTYGLNRDLPEGLAPQHVRDLIVEGPRLELVKKLSPELADAQKQTLLRLPGWERQEQAAVAASSETRPKPIVPSVDQSRIQPDPNMVYTPLPGGNEQGAPVVPDNLAAREAAAKAGPGMRLEELVKRIQSGAGHVADSDLAAQLHAQARQAAQSSPENPSVQL